MNRIADLIAKYCPNGVYYKELGNVAEVYTGEQFNKRDMEEVGLYPVINGGILPSGYSDKYNETANTITVSQGGASAGYVNFIKVRFWLGAHCYAIKPKSYILNNKFMYYCIKHQENKLMRSQEGAGIPSLNRKKLNSILIPVPPLEVQQEIVRILDSFTSLEAELEAELEARKKQYEHYRGELLSFAKKPEILEREQSWRALGEIALRHSGTNITAAQMKSLHTCGAPIRVFAGGATIADVNYSDIPNKDVITEVSIIVKSRGYIDFEYYDRPFSHKNEMWSYTIHDPAFNPKFVYYYLRNQKKLLQKLAEATSVKIPQLSVKDTDNLKIPVVPLPEQNRIVAVLDKFDALVNDISIGLPAEINARRKQYEYYRDKLLTFPMVESNA